MKIKAIGHLVKTNPKRTQSNPISGKALARVGQEGDTTYESGQNWHAYRPGGDRSTARKVLIRGFLFSGEIYTDADNDTQITEYHQVVYPM